MAATITTTIDINVSPQAVWRVLTDFAAYPDWNPFMDRIEGTPKVGAKLVVHMTPPGGRGMTFKPDVMAATPKMTCRNRLRVSESYWRRRWEIVEVGPM